MKKLPKKLILIVIATISLVVTLQVIQITYAKYVTENEVLSDVTLSQWRIKVNQQDITENKEISNLLTPVFEGNEYIAQDALVPGAEGYIEFIIDTSIVNLSCDYKITLTPDTENAITDIATIGYAINDGAKVLLNQQNSDVTGSIEKDVDETKVKVYFKWNDNFEGEQMDDVQDTQLATNIVGKLVYRADIEFVQRIENR